MESGKHAGMHDGRPEAAERPAGNPTRNPDMVDGPAKTCASCGNTNPVHEFHINRRVRDGRHRHCKQCRSDARYAKLGIEPWEVRQARRRAQKRQEESASLGKPITVAGGA